MATMSEIERYKQEAARARRTAREIANETGERFMSLTEAAGTSFALGVIEGRTGGVEIAKAVPLPLAVAIGAEIGSLALGDRLGEHLHNIAIGATANYLGTVGRGVGLASKH